VHSRVECRTNLLASETDRRPGRVARFYLVQYTKMGKIYQNGHKIYQMAINSKIYTNCDFLFENIPTGNPVVRRFIQQQPKMRKDDLHKKVNY
jgi:hypothetical protein